MPRKLRFHHSLAFESRVSGGWRVCILYITAANLSFHCEWPRRDMVAQAGGCSNSAWRRSPCGLSNSSSVAS